MQRRSKDVKQRQNLCNHPNLFTGKLICTHCGRTYYRRDSKDKQGNKNNKWVCSGKINNGSDSCPSFAIYESELLPLLYDVFCETSFDVQNIIDEYTEMYRKLESATNSQKAIETAKNRIELLNKKKSKMLEYNIQGKITDSDFIKMNNDATKEIDVYKRQTI